MLSDPKWDLDLSKPSLRGLAHILRHRELWPVGFEWDFGNCDRCAMGLAFRYWDLGELWGYVSMPKYFSISAKTAGQLFLSQDGVLVISPEMIADRIDALTETEPSERS